MTSRTRERPTLSDAQTAAVDATHGAFVDAGAGSGKTTVLVERYLRAITERNLLPANVLAVTFTKRAAGEMRERIRARLRFEGRDDLIPLVEGGWINTIHATCQQLLAEFPEEAGLTRGLRVADQVETVLLREAAFTRALAATLAEHGDAGMQLVAGYGADRLRDVVEGLFNGARTRGLPTLAPTGVATAAELAAAVEDLRRAAVEMAAAGTDSDRAQKRRRVAADLLDLLVSSPDAAELVDLADFAFGEKAYKDAIADVELLARDVIARELHAPLQDVLDRFVAGYQANKDEAGALDYDDLQLRTKQLLEDHPHVRESLCERFREVMVDEFQDTDVLQTSIINMLRHPETPLLLVGDEQQAIYGFRGADVDVFRDERARSAQPDSAVVVVPLHQNRRSLPPILGVVNAVFSREDRFVHHPLAPTRSHAGEEPLVELLVGVGDQLDRAREIEAALVARRLHDIVRDGTYSAGQIAVLFRAGTNAPAFEQALRAVGLPTVSSTGRGFLQRQVVADIVAMLRVLWNRYDDMAMVTCLASPMAGVSNDGLALMRDATKWEFTVALDQLSSIPLREDDMARAVTLVQSIERLRPLAGRLGLGDLVAAIVAETRYDLAMLVQHDGAERLANLAKLERVARSFEAARGADLPGFIRAVESGRLDTEVSTDGVTASEDDDAVRLLTIHQAKGLEFPVVVLADTGGKPKVTNASALVATDGEVSAVVPASTGKACPTRTHDRLLAAARDAEVREAHRTAYVACTRAEDRLIISGARVDGKDAQAGSTLGWLLNLIDDSGEVGERVVELDEARVAITVTTHDASPLVRADPTHDDDFVLDDGGPQLSFNVEAAITANGTPRSGLPALAPLPSADAWAAPTLSYSALDGFERCAYRFHLEHMLGVPASEAAGNAPIGKAVHAAVERGRDAGELLREIDPQASAVDQDEARAAFDRWLRSPLCARFAALPDVRHEQPLLVTLGDATATGFLDLSALDGDTLIIGDLKVALLDGMSPEERRDASYTIQQELYALAALESGHPSVEICFQWLGDEQAIEAMATHRFDQSDRARLREGLERRTAEALAGPWTPTPSPTSCAGCPALGMLCAGPDLPGNR